MSFKEGWDLGLRLGAKIDRFFSRTRVKSKKAPKGEVEKLIVEVQQAHAQSELLSNLDPDRLAASIALQAAQEADVDLDNTLIDPMMEVVLDYGYHEGIFGINKNYRIPKSNTERSNTKTKLLRNLEIYQNDNESLHVFAYFLAAVFTEIFKSLPSSCLRSEYSSNADSVFDTHILNLIDDVYQLVQGMCGEFYHQDLKDTRLFEETREILQINGMKAAGFRLDDPRSYQKEFPLPTECRHQEPDSMIEAFLDHLPLKELFFRKLPFSIPKEIRFEHAQILAPSGYGKTQLLSKFVLDDIRSGTGFCIIDSQGDLISKLLLLNKFSPSKHPDISEKLVLVDASDVEYPTCLNLFALNGELEGLSLKHKEILVNSTVDLYTYIFSALLGAELTARQNTVFVYLARLMMQIPNASITTLRELMEDGEKFRPYMEELEGSAKAFFRTEFFSRSFVQSKKQILARLWAVLSNASLERMFTSEKNEVDLFRCMNEGKIVLINTSKQVLGKTGSEIMGKFFIALITQAAIKRASLAETERKGFHVYIDEAWEYVDSNFDQFINQTRKYKVGFHLFHHHLDQLPTSVRSSINTSTAIKFVGAISAKDARIMASEMKTSADRILELKKYNYSHAEYCVHVSNLTEAAITVDVPFGLLESEPVMSSAEFEALINFNRSKFCRHISEAVHIVENRELNRALSDEELDRTDQTTENKKRSTGNEIKGRELEQSRAPTDPERGGVKHRYLQALVSQVGNSLGFVAEVEKQINSGGGFIDVVLRRGNLEIAIEISVTNSPKYEIENLRKCITAEYEHVAMLCSDALHLSAIKNAVDKELDCSVFDGVRFLNDELIKSYLEGFASPEVPTDRSHGYKVNVSYKEPSLDQRGAKQEVVNRILMNAKL